MGSFIVLDSNVYTRTVCVMPRYHPNRLFFALFLCLLVLQALAWDRQLIGGEALIAWLAKLPSSSNDTWWHAFVGRVSGLTAAMFAAFLLVLVFGALQLAGAALDRAALHRRFTWGVVIASANLLTGRSWSLPRQLRSAQFRNIHFSYGRDCLFGPLRLALWAFPVVGFIGTVVGLSGAVKSLPNALKDEAEMDRLLSSLHTAFDTTFVGLAASVAVMFLVYLLDNSWDRNDLLASQNAERSSQSETMDPDR